MEASAAEQRWILGLACALGCAVADPSSGQPNAATPPVEEGPLSPSTVDDPKTEPPDERVASDEEDEAWARVDQLFDHIVWASTRWPLLDGLDDSAIERSASGVRRLVYRFGVRSFEPDPTCDPERAKCRSVPVWSARGGVYLELRAHRDQHAAGAFDAVHSLGPLTIEVTLHASDPVLRATLLREIGVFAGERGSSRPGCPDPITQAETWMRDEQRARGMEGAEKIRMEPDEFAPFSDSVDLDGDGMPELVLAHLDYGRNAEHYFYLEREGCPTLVAVIHLWAVSGVGCQRISGQPLCELLTNELMVHGDQQASTWHFDGTHYIEVDTRR